MNILNGINNFLMWVDANWVSIVVFIGLVLGIWQKVKSYMELSTEEKIEAAKVQIQEAILELITKAELEYEAYDKAGEIKRSEVISEVYSRWPILEKVVDQEALLEWLDELIDNALVTLREVIEINTEGTEEEK